MAEEGRYWEAIKRWDQAIAINDRCCYILYVLLVINLWLVVQNFNELFVYCRDAPLLEMKAQALIEAKYI